MTSADSAPAPGTGSIRDTWLDPSTVAQFVARDRCPRFIRQAVAGDEEATARNWKEAYGVLNPALLGYGSEVEAEHVETLASNAETLIGPDIDTTAPVAPHVDFDATWDPNPHQQRKQLLDAVRTAATLPRTPGTPRPYVLLFQAPLRGHIGAYPLAGDADLIALAPTSHPTPQQQNSAQDEESCEPADHERITDESGSVPAQVEARVIEIKSSNEEHAAHRIQVSMYAALLRQTLDEGLAELGVEVTGTVLVDAEGTRPGEVGSPFETDPFDLAAWQLNVERLLAADGPIAEALDEPLSELSFGLDQQCTNCAYQEACMTRAAEAAPDPQGLAMLGLGASQQDRLQDVGLDTIQTLSELAPRPTRPYPRDDPVSLTVTPAQQEALDEAVGGAAHGLVQRAQAVRGTIDPNYQSFPQPPAIQGTDWVPLPTDTKPGWGNLDDAEQGDLIHVALIVRPDPTINRLAGLAATVNARNHDTPITITEVIDAVPSDPARADAREADLVDRFLTGLFDAIETVARDLGNPENAVVHTYFYSRQALEALVEGLDRHDDHQHARALQSLLSLREPCHTQLDQDMVSVVQPTLNEHFALTHPNQGLLPVLREFTNTVPPLVISSPPGRSATALSLFGHKYLQCGVPYLETTDSIRLHTNPGPLEESQAAAAVDTDPPQRAGMYPVRKREGAMVPIEYLWAVTPERKGAPEPRLRLEQIDDGTLDDETRQLYTQEINRFRDPLDGQGAELQRTDVEWLLGELSHAFLDLIHAIPYKDAYLDKQPLDATTLSEIDLLDMSLAANGRDYLRLEFDARKTDTESLYRRSLRDRLKTGRSLAFECTSIDPTDDGGLRVHGEFIYDDLFEPGRAAALTQQLRLHGGDESGNGSWLVLTRLTPTHPADDEAPPSPSSRAYEPVGVEEPEHRKHSPPAFIDALNPTDGTVTLHLFPHRFRKHYSEFRTDHTGWQSTETSNVDPDTSFDGYVADRDPVWIEPGEHYVLDPLIDDLTSPKADRALAPDTITHNTVYRHLTMANTIGHTGHASVGDPDALSQFLDKLEATTATDTPNPDQHAVITDLRAPILPVQGPAGSGKTSGAAAPALLGRTHAALTTNHPFLAIGVAPSHKAVDALLDGVVERLDEYREAYDWFDALDLVRVRPSQPTTNPTETVTPNVEVTSLNYYDETHQQILVNLVAPIVGVQQRLDPDTSAVLIFVTPSTLYRVLGVLAEGLDPIDGDTAPAAMRHPDGLADVICVDEASMTTIPQLLLAGSPLTPRGQLILAGDHRQLATVSAHDWPNELRAPIQRTTVYTSALEYIRHLNHRSPSTPTPGSTHPRDIHHRVFSDD